MSNNIPSINPADNGTLAGTLNFVFNKLTQQTDGMLPAQVISYDRTNNRVNVQLLITLITTDGSQIPRAQLASVPVLLLGGGNFSISFPLNEGDLGWILANDRDISLFLQSYAQSPPNSFRVKQFSDGVFIPDAMKSYNIDDDNEGYMIIQSQDGTIAVSMGVNPTSGLNEVNVVADQVNIILNNETTDFVNIYGNLAVSGTITNTLGAITAVAPLPHPAPYPS